MLDTDVLIDYLLGRQEAATCIESMTDLLSISVITVAELYAGVCEGAERTVLDNFIQAFEVIPVSREIAVQGGLYKRDYGKSHNTGLADALIAATAIRQHAMLTTLNAKHFPMIKNMFVPYTKI